MMEHELNPKTVEQIKNLVKFVKTAPDYPEWLDHFEIFCETGGHSCKEKKRMV
jgi:Mn-dependent DtxR family transcriptional regulator